MKKTLYYKSLTLIKPTCALFQWLCMSTAALSVYEAIQRQSLLYLFFALLWFMITLQFYFVQKSFTDKMIERYEQAVDRWKSIRLNRRQRRKMQRLKLKRN